MKFLQECILKIKKRFNNEYFFETQLLMYLYKKEEVSTKEIEEIFGGENDKQVVNNVICNDKNNTSLIKRGYLQYDRNSQILTITAKGRNSVRKMFSMRRTSKRKTKKGI